MLDITADVRKTVRESAVSGGICHVFVPHTTAGLTINENADPDVVRDIERHMSKLVPEDGGYSHGEGNSDGHIKSSLFGASLALIVEGGDIVLGQWQAVYFCEFDGPRTRKVYIKTVKG